MAYNVKYRLVFSDEIGRPIKVEILKKNYEGAIQDVIGTGNPLTIKWDGDDDIYKPIIGSRCIIELFVTDDIDYDEFWRYDEREFKVRVFKSTALEGEITWDTAPFVYDLTDNNWDNQVEGAAPFFERIWEGYVVADRFIEAMTPKPYPIKVEAIDGLGTLDLFDTPINLETAGDVVENLFFYLKEILLLTGHEHDIFISNPIKLAELIEPDDSESIFHQIDVNEYAFFTSKLIPFSAKETLEAILKITNSRIFHSYGHWYIMNNSAVIDNRINELTEGESDEDNTQDDDAIDPNAKVAPNVEIVVNGIRAGVDNTVDVPETFSLFFDLINTGGEIETATWSYLNETVVQNLANPALFLTHSSSFDDVTFSITCTNTLDDGSTGTSTDDVIINIVPIELEEGQEEGEINIIVNNTIENTRVTPPNYSITFIEEVDGDDFIGSFVLSPLPNYQIALSDVVASISDSAYAVNKTQNGNNIVLTVTGSFAGGSTQMFLNVSGTAQQREYDVTITIDNDILNSSIVGGNTVTMSAVYQGSFTKTVRLSLNTGYLISLDNISALFQTGDVAQREIREVLNSDGTVNYNQVDIVFTGVITSNSNVTDTLTLTGTAFSGAEASAFESNYYVPTSYQTIQLWNIQRGSKLDGGIYPLTETFHYSSSATIGTPNTQILSGFAGLNAIQNFKSIKIAQQGHPYPIDGLFTVEFEYTDSNHQDFMRLVTSNHDYDNIVEIPVTKVWNPNECLDIYIQPRTALTSGSRTVNIKLLTYPSENEIVTYSATQTTATVSYY